jgi:hypothetical protein
MQVAQYFHNDRTSSFMAIMITVGAHVYHDILDAGGPCTHGFLFTKN